MKKFLCLILSLLAVTSLFSCGNKQLSDEQKNELCSYYWQSVADVLQFTSDGKLLRNFEYGHESDSRYIIEDGKITMYTEASPEDALTFSFEMSEDTIRIGEVEYKKYEKIGK